MPSMGSSRLLVTLCICAQRVRTRNFVRSIYVWDRDLLATAIVADLAVVGVALRNAMHTVLNARRIDRHAWLPPPTVATHSLLY